MSDLERCVQMKNALGMPLTDAELECMGVQREADMGQVDFTETNLNPTAPHRFPP